jgi:mitochondrial import inner membrane translocase subunit TIM54
MIFITITSSWTAAIMYDRRQKKKNQKKWCDLVAHIAQQPLQIDQMARKITVFLSAPPGDGMRPSREYFKQYVKPVLVAAAMDYDVIEGRKEGDVRYGTAEQIRRMRRKNGEKGEQAEADVHDSSRAVQQVRDSLGITFEPGAKGDLVLGRHTWKEYVRGIHEGWLGPLDALPEPEPLPTIESESTTEAPVHSIGEPSDGADQQTVHESSGETDEVKKESEKKKTEEQKKKPYPPPSYLLPSEYASSNLAPTTPEVFEPSQPIHQQHLLGFLKTPVRIWNYLNQRHLADRVGRETAAIVLAASRPYSTDASTATVLPSADNSSPTASLTDNTTRPPSPLEQDLVLAIEESTWHKSVRKPRKEGDDSESIWTADMVLDARIADRMRRFELDADEAARAERIGKGEEQGRAYKVRDLRSEPVKYDRAYEDE